MSDDKKIIFSMVGVSKSFNNNNTQVLKDGADCPAQTKNNSKLNPKHNNV